MRFVVHDYWTTSCSRDLSGKIQIAFTTREYWTLVEQGLSITGEVQNVWRTGSPTTSVPEIPNERSDGLGLKVDASMLPSLRSLEVPWSVVLS